LLLGVAKQDQLRQKELEVYGKSARVANFHRNTLRALAELVEKAGVDHPDFLVPAQFMLRTGRGEMRSGQATHPWLPEGFLLEGKDLGRNYLDRWNWARPDQFGPVG